MWIWIVVIAFKNLQYCALAFDYRATVNDIDDANPLKVISTSSLVLWSGIDLTKSFTHTNLYMGSAIFVAVFYILLTVGPSKFNPIQLLTNQCSQVQASRSTLALSLCPGMDWYC